MPKREDEPTKRIHLWIYDTDHQWLIDHFGDSTGVSKAVRKLIRAFRRKTEAKAAEIQEASPSVEVAVE